MKKITFLIAFLLTCTWFGTTSAQESPSGINHTIYKNQNDLKFMWTEGIPSSSTVVIRDSGIPCVETQVGGSSYSLKNNSYALKYTATNKVRLERLRAYIRPETAGSIAFKIRVLGLNSGTSLPDESNIIDTSTTGSLIVTNSAVGTWVDIVPAKNIIIEAGTTVFLEIKATGQAADSRIYVDRGPEQLYSYMKGISGWVLHVVDNYMIRAQFTQDLTTPLKQLTGYNFYKGGVKLNTTPLSFPYFIETGVQAGSYAYTVKSVYDGVETAASAPYNLNFNTIDYTYTFENSEIPEDCKVYDLNRDGSSFVASSASGGYSSHYGSKSLISTKTAKEVFVTKLIAPTTQEHIFSFFTLAGPLKADSYMLVKISETGQALGDYTILLDSVTPTSGDWKNLSYDLSAYIGKRISIGFFAVSTSADYFMIDDILLPPFYKANKDIGMESMTSTKLAIADSVTKIECVIKNKGLSDATNVSVKLINIITNTELTRIQAPVDLAIGEEKTVTINWVSAVTGEFKVRAEIVYAEDMESYNNSSETVRISMQDNNASFFPLGNKASTNISYPINFSYKNSGSELLYYPSELTKSGSIEAIVLEYRFVEDILNQPIKVKIGKTSVFDLGTKAANYIDPSTLTEVFNGTLDFYAEDGFVIIPFNTSFKYNLDTLVINIEKSFTDQKFNTGNVFYNSAITATNRTAFWMADTAVTTTSGQMTVAKTKIPLSRLADINFIFNTSLEGRIYGTIKDINGVGMDSVTVALEGSNLVVTTNVSGEYTIKGTNPGTYTLATYKYPYAKETMSITIAEGEQINQNFILTPLPKIKVAGKVIDKQSGEGIANARVFLEETETFSATANTAGEFTLENVVATLNYEFFAIGDNHTQYAGKITTTNADTNIGNISLSFNLAPAIGVTIARRATTDSTTSLQWDKVPVKTGFYEDFENYADFTLDFAPFTTVDVDKYKTGAFQIVQFKHQLEPMSFIIFNASKTGPPMTTADTAFSKSMSCSGDRIAAAFFPYNDKLKPVTVTNNDWLISPRMHVETGGTFQFEARTYRAYPNGPNNELEYEKFEVLVSTKGRHIKDFTMIAKCDSTPVLPWGHYSYDLSAYAGQDVYVAIRCVSHNIHMFMVDDVRLINPSSQTEPEFVKYNVYRFHLADTANKANWALLGETTTKAFTDNTLSVTGDYKYAIVAIYTSDREAAPAYSVQLSKTEETGINDIQKNQSQIKVYPNPANNYVMVTAVEPIKEVTVKSITGILIAQYPTKGEYSYQADISKFSKGIYFVTVRTNNGTKTVKVVKQ